MPMHRESVTGRELQSHRVLTSLARITADDGELHSGIEARRREGVPGETVVGHYVDVWRIHWTCHRGCARHRCRRYRSVESNPPLTVDLAPYRCVVAAISHLALRSVHIEDVSPIIVRRRRARDLYPRRRKAQGR